MGEVSYPWKQAEERLGEVSYPWKQTEEQLGEQGFHENRLKHRWGDFRAGRASLKCFRVCAQFTKGVASCFFVLVSPNKFRTFQVLRHNPSRSQFYFTFFSRPQFSRPLLPPLWRGGREEGMRGGGWEEGDERRWTRGGGRGDGEERRGTRYKKYKTLVTRSPISSIHAQWRLTASDPGAASVMNVERLRRLVWQVSEVGGGRWLVVGVREGNGLWWCFCFWVSRVKCRVYW